MPKTLGRVEYRDHSKGTIRTVQPSLAPKNSHFAALNMDSDKIIGALRVRLGTERLGVQMAGGSKSCLGYHQHFETAGTALFATYSDGTNNDIYLVATGAKSLQDDTKDLKTNFLTYLGKTVRVNGTDNCKEYNAADGWLAPASAVFIADDITDYISSTAHGLVNNNIIKLTTTSLLPGGLSILTFYYVINKTTDTFQLSLTQGGTAINIINAGVGTHTWEKKTTFDLVNMPKFKEIVEWKDRVFGIGATNGIIEYSSVADPISKTIHWTRQPTISTSAGYISVEQEDNGGDIVALAKVPGYLLMFKNRSMKRWSGSSTFPEDLIDQGVYSKECVCQGKEMVFLINTKGIWATNGNYPVRISKPVQDIIDLISPAGWGNVCLTSDGEYLYAYLGNLEINSDGDTINNVTLKYNIASESWDIYSYYNTFKMFRKYIDSDGVIRSTGADNNGQILQLNYGFTDYDSTVRPITYTYDTQEIELNSRANIKSLSKINVFTKNIKSGNILLRADSGDYYNWKPIKSIEEDITHVTDLKVRCHYFNLKITGVSNLGGETILGWELPDKSVIILDNTK